MAQSKTIKTIYVTPEKWDLAQQMYPGKISKMLDEFLSKLCEPVTDNSEIEELKEKEKEILNQINILSEKRVDLAAQINAVQEKERQRINQKNKEKKEKLNQARREVQALKMVGRL